MLVLSRKQAQEIHIGDDIVITVLKVRGNTVQLGIKAPRDVRIRRGELPKHSETPIKAGKPHSIAPELAEFTVVFSNTTDDPGANVDVVPFESTQSRFSTDKPNDDGPDSVGRDRSSNPSGHSRDSRFTNRDDKDSAPDTIRFRNRLPTSLDHNRLKEIVEQLTSKD